MSRTRDPLHSPARLSKIEKKLGFHTEIRLRFRSLSRKKSVTYKLDSMSVTPAISAGTLSRWASARRCDGVKYDASAPSPMELPPQVRYGPHSKGLPCHKPF